jgi:putative iron-regulated protein
MRWRLRAQIVVLLCSLGCAKPAEGPPPFPEAEAKKALTTYADIAAAAYAESVREAKKLEAAIGALVASPSDDTLARARAQWVRARIPYRQTEVYRFYEGPIDEVELLVNTWPIDESYVEAAAGAAVRGVVDDPARYPALSEALLVSLNAKGGETSISTGYHVIEFLLWGRDESESGPGARPFTDYQGEGAQRRGQYLELAAHLLTQHLEQVAAAWQPGQNDNYRARFLAKPPREALGLAVRGMGSLSGPELSGERLTVALETRDQENEHSCFSDTTSDDVVGNARGIENLCLGRYQPLEGPALQGTGLCDVLERVTPGLGKDLARHVAASVAAARAIPGPFDRALTGSDDAPGRKAIRATIDALTVQTRDLERAAGALALGVGGKP